MGVEWRSLSFVVLLALSCGDSGPGDGENNGSSSTAPASTSMAGLSSSTTSTPTPTSLPGTTAQSTGSGRPGTSSGSGSGSSGSTTGEPVDGPLTFAIIGDFGADGVTQLGLGATDDVAELVKSWDPDFVATVGDNNYPDGLAISIDNNIGKYYQEYIGNYVGSFGPGSTENRFWPTLGNHDWESGSVQAHYDYFTLPGNERYYDVDFGLVHLFMVDSESEEPDGATYDSVQGQWLHDTMVASDACFKLVLFHRPPFSSGERGSSERMDWPFAEWGADAVLAGHDHAYERLTAHGLPYFVNGLGGQLRYQLEGLLENSEIFYNSGWGAQLVTVTEADITFEFITTTGETIDTYSIPKECKPKK